MKTTPHALVYSLTALLFDISLMIDAGDIKSYDTNVNFEVLVNTRGLNFTLQSEDGTTLIDKEL